MLTKLRWVFFALFLVLFSINVIPRLVESRVVGNAAVSNNGVVSAVAQNSTAQDISGLEQDKDRSSSPSVDRVSAEDLLRNAANVPENQWASRIPSVGSEGYENFIHSAVVGTDPEAAYTAAKLLQGCQHASESALYLEKARLNTKYSQDQFAAAFNAMQAELRRCQSISAVSYSRIDSLLLKALSSNNLGVAAEYWRVKGGSVPDQYFEIISRRMLLDGYQGHVDTIHILGTSGARAGLDEQEQFIFREVLKRLILEKLSVQSLLDRSFSETPNPQGSGLEDSEGKINSILARIKERTKR